MTTLSPDELAELRSVLDSAVADALDTWNRRRGEAAPVAKAPPPPVTKPVTPPGLAPQYAWLARLGPGAPLTITHALAELGVKEVAGGANSPVIMGWAAEVGLQAVYTNDAIPWCGLFAAVIVKRAGKVPVKDPLWAKNWAQFGREIDDPGLGDVLVFTRDGGGHVAFYVGEDASHYHIIGGNQADAVNIMRKAKVDCIARRRPIYRNQPTAVRPYHLAATGAVSTNEA